MPIQQFHTTYGNETWHIYLLSQPFSKGKVYPKNILISDEGSDKIGKNIRIQS